MKIESYVLFSVDQGGSVMKRILAIALTFVLIFTVLMGCMSTKTSSGLDETQPSSSQEQGTKPPSIGQETQPSNPTVSGGVTNLKIDSLDKWNYYAALCMVTGIPTVSKQSATDSHYEFALLTAGAANKSEEIQAVPDVTEIAPTEVPTLPDATEITQTEGPPLAPDNPDTTAPSKDIYYYTLNPDQAFHVNEVSMFQIELTDENGYLASKLGIGLVDVVIAEDCIWGDSLITFRNGDNFFSCLTNGWHRNTKTGGERWDFSTHKYVEGFHVVKNFQQQNYTFYIDADAEGQIFALECRSQNGSEDADQNVKVVGDTRISTQGGEFTIAELEAYFNSETAV